MKPPDSGSKAIDWTGGPQEYAGARGRRVVAKIVLSYDGHWLYDQRDVGAGPLGAIVGGPLPLDECKRRAETDLQ